MAIERNWVGVPAQLFTSNGGVYGQVSVPSTADIKVKQRVKVGSNTQETKDLEVKRVINETDLLLGPIGSSMSGPNSYVDLSLFLTATNSYLVIPEAPRNPIPPDAFWRAVYEEEPTVAIRTFAVDHLGRRYTESNPLPVQLSNGSIDIGTVNAQLEMFITHKDNDPHAGDVHSSLRIGDGEDEVEVNPDGSLNVVVVNGGAASTETKFVFDEVSSVPVNSETQIVTYTVPLAKTAVLDRITGSGENIAKYCVYLNGVRINTKRTYYAGGFNVEFNYMSQGLGVKLQAGDVLELRVLQETPELGDFDGLIQIVELG